MLPLSSSWSTFRNITKSQIKESLVSVEIRNADFYSKSFDVATNILVVFVLINPATCRQTNTSGSLSSSLSQPQVRTCSSLCLRSTFPHTQTHTLTKCALSDCVVPRTRFFLTKQQQREVSISSNATVLYSIDTDSKLGIILKMVTCGCILSLQSNVGLVSPNRPRIFYSAHFQINFLTQLQVFHALFDSLRFSWRS